MFKLDQLTNKRICRVMPSFSAMLFSGLFLMQAIDLPAQDFVDPTRPPNVRAVLGQDSGSTLSLHLTTIILTSNIKLAIINGHRVRENQKIAGYLVTKILPKKVHLVKNGKKMTIELPSARLKSVIQRGKKVNMSNSENTLKMQGSIVGGLGYVK